MTKLDQQEQLKNIFTDLSQQSDITVRTVKTLIRSVITELSRAYCQRYNDIMTKLDQFNLKLLNN